LALIFDKLGIDTNDVIDAAATKWNFLKYRPGLVGGHCIGVDPYYLAFKAEAVGYYPDVIRSGRRVNDNMAGFVANKVIKLMIKKGLKILNSNILLLGVTFKENCPDIRNTKVIDIVDELQEFGCKLDILDPWANQKEVEHEFGIKTLDKNTDIYAKKYDAIILAVSHDQFKTIDFNRLKNGQNAVIFDIKGLLPKDLVDGRL
jgi:UDP-N-acetyl-D-galactosamine dehydrogenase